MTFKCQREKLDSPIKLKLYPSKSVKYIGIRIDENLNCEQYIYDITTKLNRTNALIFTVWSYVDRHILRSIYFSIFDSPINYTNFVRGKNSNAVSKIVFLQKKQQELWIFRDSHSNPLLKFKHNLKRKATILIEDILLTSKSINNHLPPNCNGWFIFCSDIRNYNIVSSSTSEIFKSSYRNDCYRKKSITVDVIHCCNKTQHQSNILLLRANSQTKIKI